MKFHTTVAVLGTAALLQFCAGNTTIAAPTTDSPQKATEDTLNRAIRDLKSPRAGSHSSSQSTDTVRSDAAPASPTGAKPAVSAFKISPLSVLLAPPAPPVVPSADSAQNVTLDLVSLHRRPAKAGRRESADADIKRALDKRRKTLAREALSFRGTPYVWGGSTPRAFDCSGFTRYLYKKQFGINLPHNAKMQFRLGKPVSRGKLKPGDLVFFNTRGPLTHVGMYIGNGRFVHAANPRRGVRVDKLAAYYLKVYAGARRYTK